MNTRAIVLVGAGVVAGAMSAAAITSPVSVANAAPGTLNPPAGPVQGTGRTLDEIYDRIEATELQVVTLTANAGPWQNRTEFPGNTDRFKSQTIASGRVLVHSIIVYWGDVVVFDGEGTVDSEGAVVAGTPVGFARDFALAGGYANQASQVVIDTIVENGLDVSWNSRSVFFSYTILYRELD